jgi:hypothetical protein
MINMDCKNTKANDLDRLACELLFDAPYCARLLEAEWTYADFEPLSYQERRVHKAELSAALRWLSGPAFLGALSEPDRDLCRRLILAHHVSDSIEQRLESKLGSWGEKLLRSLLSRFGRR